VVGSWLPCMELNRDTGAECDRIVREGCVAAEEMLDTSWMGVG
jgi:hypothetical protein